MALVQWHSQGIFGVQGSGRRGCPRCTRAGITGRDRLPAGWVQDPQVFMSRMVFRRSRFGFRVTGSPPYSTP